VNPVGEAKGVTYKGKHGVPVLCDFCFTEARAFDRASPSGRSAGQ
jgi:hypothetical protein